MKKTFIAFIIMFFFISCSASDKQIQEAIIDTEIAGPTLTSTPEPTNTEMVIPSNTPTPTQKPSPTSAVKQIDDLSYEDVLDLFTTSGFSCGEWEIGEKGYYEQTCTTSSITGIPDSVIMGQIVGVSEDTTFGFFFVFTPYETFDAWEDLEALLIDMVDFGDRPEENIVWVKEIFEIIKNSNEEFAYEKIYNDTEIKITGGSEVVSLIVLASD